MHFSEGLMMVHDRKAFGFGLRIFLTPGSQMEAQCLLSLCANRLLCFTRVASLYNVTMRYWLYDQGD